MVRARGRRWGRWALVVSVSLLLTWVGSVGGLGTKCRREPLHTTAHKTPGDNDYRIKISGNPGKYVPGEVYTVSVQGKRDHSSVKKFTSFMLIVESMSSPPGSLYGPQSVGIFHLYGSVLTMHSDDCPNAVTQTSSIPKSDIQARWTAPPAGSGCLRFRATVVQQRDEWYMDDGELTKELCEEVQVDINEQPEVITNCCACNEAKYEVTFEGLWSRQTHPKDFPRNEWLTHFSDIIGASHSDAYRIWDYGAYASDGLRQVAERGSTRILESELKRQSDHIRTIIKARGLWHPSVNGKTFAVFRVDNRHHLVSLVSMLGPSPDWIVGVSALELCQRDSCDWLEQKVLNLYPWDAGTDSGVTYESAKVPTIPRQKIRRITNSYPNNQMNPFYDTKGQAMKPLARLTITRQRVYEKKCSSAPIVDEDQERPECDVSDWSVFTPCSVTCGKGLTLRSRKYVMHNAFEMGCNRQLEQKEFCSAKQLFCEGGSYTHMFNETVQEDPICETSEWSTWTACPVTCGKGFRQRTRKYKNRMGRKKCSKETTDRRMCLASVNECEYSENNRREEEVIAECMMTAWSDWSPCSATCGSGIMARKRAFFVPAASEQHNCNDTKLLEKESCVGERKDCNFDEAEAKVICNLEMDTGGCRGYFLRYYYNASREMCIQFTYGGCKGNANNFKKMDECHRNCEFLKVSQRLPQGITIENSYRHPVNCKISKWSAWSTCAKTCGPVRTFKTKTRTVEVESRNGGRACRKKMTRKKRCHKNKCSNRYNGLEILSQIFDPNAEYASPIAPTSDERAQMSNPGLKPGMSQYGNYRSSSDVDLKTGLSLNDYDDINSDCEMGEWGPWSPCTHSCGPEALQQRQRSIIAKPRGGGALCGQRLNRRYCTLPPCPHQRDKLRLHRANMLHYNWGDTWVF